MFTLEPIPDTMPAAVLEGPKTFRVREIPTWRIDSYGNEDLVLIKVEAVGVCGSDFRYYLGENPWAQATLGRFVPNPPNIVLGHEYAGTVVAVQTEKNRHLLGKRVAPVCSQICNACEECRAGRSRLCPNTVHMGHGQGWGEQDFFPGAYATYAPAWGVSCYELRDETGIEEAALMDILAVCVHVCEQGRIQPGRPVLTIGAGPAGNGVAQTALCLGASSAILLDRSETAIRVAEKQGIGTALNVKEPGANVQEELARLAPQGFGTVFDTVGSAATLDLGLKALGQAGTFVTLAPHDEAISFNFLRLGGERSIVTSNNFEIGDYAKALAWLESGRLRVKDWITKIKLEDLPGWFERITANPDEKGVFKLVVRPLA